MDKKDCNMDGIRLEACVIENGIVRNILLPIDAFIGNESPKVIIKTGGDIRCVDAKEIGLDIY